MAVQPLNYQQLLNKFVVRPNMTYTYNAVSYNDNGQPDRPSITRSTVRELDKGDRYFKVMGLAHHIDKPYIKIEIFEKGTNNPVHGLFALTERMGFDDLTEYQPPGGGNKRRRTKKSKKSKRKRSFK
jgi:hypothetical protein